MEVKAAESMAAICFEIGAGIGKDPDQFEQARQTLGGFPAIWDYVRHAAESFVQAERKLKPDWSNGRWIDAIDSFSLFVLTKLTSADLEYVSVDQARRIIEARTS